MLIKEKCMKYDIPHKKDYFIVEHYPFYKMFKESVYLQTVQNPEEGIALINYKEDEYFYKKELFN